MDLSIDLYQFLTNVKGQGFVYEKKAKT